MFIRYKRFYEFFHLDKAVLQAFKPTFFRCYVLDKVTILAKGKSTSKTSLFEKSAKRSLFLRTFNTPITHDRLYFHLTKTSTSSPSFSAYSKSWSTVKRSILYLMILFSRSGSKLIFSAIFS